ncbi:hypothetical protein [Phaeodactylibacter sp.]|uniref:hypothetical protein n=1 Tax=Phaeodactylibacter sp. TaxID=1940289 RepID=UPI0025E0A469|nr:hypothetical protein [Phaeodactylibacter sp.]MCI4650819.1 hypothetical protein [Phaeodactylibacter sp.]MCI5089776.1 hypothetical protein [Phaeodactylibacter sp.]
MKDLRFFRHPEDDVYISTALFWGDEQVSNRFSCQQKDIDFLEESVIGWQVKRQIEPMMAMAPLEALYLLHTASEIENHYYLLEWFTPKRINKLRVAFEAADEETETKLQEHLALVQVCVAHYNHFQKKVA